MPGSETAVTRIRRHWPAIAFLFAAAALFLIANRGAYRGYFVDDELDNLAFTNQLFPSDFAEGFLKPVFYQNNFRPAGHLFFRLMGDRFGLWFPPYIAALHFLHLLNVLLLLLVLRRLQLPPVACGAGALFFAFHMAVLDVYWKPMYVFDLLCGTFILVSFLLWMSDGWTAWVVSLLATWLAFRSKEIAVMMPLALGVYELLLGRKRWLRLIPFAAFSLWFGIRGLIHASDLKTDYSLSFQLSDLWKTAQFYSSKLLTLPYQNAAVLLALVAGLLVAAVLVRDRRVILGLSMFGAMLLPMLLLPGRLFGAYLYVPLIGLSISAACIAARQTTWVLAIFFAFWLPWNYAHLRSMRPTALAEAEDRREYVAALAKLASQQPAITTFIYQEGPLLRYGADAAARWLHPGKSILVATEDQHASSALLQAPKLAILYWDRNWRRLDTIVRTPAIGSYVHAGPDMPVWQLEDGWFPGEGLHRWTKPHAAALLQRPSGAANLEITVNVNDEYIAKVQRSNVRLALDGVPCGEFDLTKTGLQSFRVLVPAGTPGTKKLTIDVDPPYPGNEPMGIAVVGFGFV